MAAIAAGAAGTARRRVLADAANAVLGAVATAAGWVSGRVLRVAPSLPGVAGAAGVSAGAGFLASHIWGHGLAPWVGLTVGGVFALALDRRLP